MKTCTGLQSLYKTLSNNNDSANAALGLEIMNDSIRRVCSDRDWDFLQKSATANTVAAQQFYYLPEDYSSLIDVSVTLGTTKYIPRECPTREYWDMLNQETSFQSNFPEYYFIYNGQIGFYPTPSSSTSNAITYNYRRTVIDLSIDDYTTGTLSATNGSTTVTGSGTSWTSPMTGRFIRITPSNTAASTGDGFWYEIASVTNSTTIVLVKAYNGTTTTGAAYTLGQVPALPEPYQDMPIYEACRIFYTSVNPDAERAKEFKDRFDELFTKLSADHGTKTMDPVIHDAMPAFIQNPNNYLSFS